MVSSPRAGRKLTPHELARFLALLAETGNFALACLALGRAKSGLYKRRLRDGLFDSECVAALALARSSLLRSNGEVAAGSADGAASPLTLTTYAGRPQFRRAAPGRLTRAGLDRFLQTLAATGNVRFAAASVGVAHSSIYARARRDPGFAADMAAALDTARAALEMRLIEATGAFADFFPSQTSSPLAGEGRGERAFETESDPDPTGNFTTRMTVAEAIRLVGRLQRKLDRGGL